MLLKGSPSVQEPRLRRRSVSFLVETPLVVQGAEIDSRGWEADIHSLVNGKAERVLPFYRLSSPVQDRMGISSPIRLCKL